jgi:hypothetical protein
MKKLLMLGASALLAVTAATAASAAETLPDPTTEEFCMRVQQVLSNTERTGANTVFTNMPAYRRSKPKADYHLIYQVVTYRGEMPIMVSCKIKDAAHLRDAYGEDAAGEQLFCPTMTRMIRDQAAAELEAGGDAAAAGKVRSFVVNDNEPYATGQSYLADFELSYVGDDGAIHLNSPSLFQNYDKWYVFILPERIVGMVYCHLPTVDYLKALATGAMAPGTLVTTAEDAPVRPVSN